MLEFGDIVTLENNLKYVVASTCIYQEKFYAYFVNIDNSQDCILGEVENEDLKLVEDPEKFVEIMPLILDNIDLTVLEEGGNNEE